MRRPMTTTPEKKFWLQRALGYLFVLHAQALALRQAWTGQIRLFREAFGYLFDGKAPLCSRWLIHHSHQSSDSFRQRDGVA